MRDKTVSIAMAVCNGEKYIAQQIDSILCQLEQRDELILSYDPSNDKTFKIIKEYEKEDGRITVVENFDHNKGLVNNFENALRNCRNEIIFYSDQDDVWLKNKIDKIVNCFTDPKVTVAIHDAKLVDENLNIIAESTFEIRGGNTSLWKNLIRLSYIGCCMAFRRDMLSVVLPLATNKRSYDWWTGTICSCYGKMVKIDEQLILHRMHSSNATPPKRPSISYQVSVRVRIIVNMIIRRLLGIRGI